MKVIFTENHLSESEKSKIIWEFLYEFIKICSEIALDEETGNTEDD